MRFVGLGCRLCPAVMDVLGGCIVGARDIFRDYFYRWAGVFRMRGARGRRESITGELDAFVLTSKVLGVTVVIPIGVEFVVEPDRTDSGGEEIVPLSR